MAARKPRTPASDDESPSKRGPSERGLTARRKLIAAAYDVMSRKGLEGSTIAEIIVEAGVGVGSFYNHFTSKEELAQAVFSNRANEFGAALEQVVRRAPNAAAATCYAYRRLIEESERDKVWASFIVQLEPTMQMLDNMLRKYARVGLGIGVEEGLLRVYNIEAGITAIHAMEVAIVKSMLAGDISHKEAHRSAVFALKMFGVSDDEAWRLSNLSMGALRRELKIPTREKGAGRVEKVSTTARRLQGSA
jgi:AcrR family transcriptional regulator